MSSSPLVRACATTGSKARRRRWRKPEALLDAPLEAPLEAPLALEHTRTRQLPRQLGTLGGGNHFRELERDPEGWLWVVVHTGSRGLGAGIASHHRRVADPGRGPLAGLEVDSPAGQDYLRDLTWALDFARANREALLERAVEVVAACTGVEPDRTSLVDVHHNVVSQETHEGRALWVHRKAVPAGSIVVLNSLTWHR